MTEEETRSKAAQDILDELRELRDRLAQIERLLEKVALGLGVSP